MPRGPAVVGRDRNCVRCLHLERIFGPFATFLFRGWVLFHARRARGADRPCGRLGGTRVSCAVTEVVEFMRKSTRQCDLPRGVNLSKMAQERRESACSKARGEDCCSGLPTTSRIARFGSPSELRVCDTYRLHFP